MAVEFWEGNDATQDGWSVSTQTTKTYDLTQDDQPVPNDEARSCSLVDVKGGTVIEVFNSPQGNTDEGAATITVLQDIGGAVVIPTFQEDIISEKLTMDYNDNGKLDGKVSLIKIAAG